MSHEFHSLRVSQIVRETEQASSIYFEVPEELSDSYRYKAGQYLTLKFNIKGTEVRRAYSICTSPLDKKLGVNVKRVNKGLVSNHINDNIKEGDTIEVMQPDGSFGIDHDHNQAREFYLIASGSGITPIMSILKTLLEEEPKSRCHLLYGNKNEKSVIFKDQLIELQSKYAGQFFYKQTLSQPVKTKGGGLKGMFSRGKESWTGWKGRLDGKKIDAYLDENPPVNKDVHYFVCGPGAMIDTLVDHLENKGIAKDSIHTEHFITTAPAGGGLGASSGVASKVKAHLNGKEFDFEVSSDKTILDVMIDEKIDAPYSCTSGACSTCIAKLVKGDVSMDACYALDDDEVASGYILVCQSRAQSAEVELTFDT